MFVPHVLHKTWTF